MPLVAQIQQLIDKKDNRELVRDQIAAILKVESEQQQVLATAASRDPNLWKLRVYTERSDPWSAFSDEPSRRIPIINVWIENSNFEKGGSDPIRHQKSVGTFHIDCLGFGVSEKNDNGSHTAADKLAVSEAERAVRLARNILMSSYYTYLGFPQGKYLPPGSEQVVWSRFPASITAYQPSPSERPVERVAAIRLDLEVTYSEFSPQYVGQELELISSTLVRSPDGEWLTSLYP